MLLRLRTCLALLVILVQVHTQGIRSFQKEWILHEKEIILSRDQTSLEVNSAGENRFLYALCEEGHWKPKKICDVIVETYTAENLTYKRTCKLKLETAKDSRMIGRNFILTHLGIDKAIFMWLDREKVNWQNDEILLRIRVINWFNCEFTDIKIPIDVQNGLVDEISFNNVIVYKNTFDIFFYSKTMCQNFKCKATYDANGKRIGEIEPFLPIKDNSPLSLIFPISTTTSKGYFAFTWISGYLATTHININAKANELINVHFKGYITFSVSNNYEIFGLCWLPLHGDTKVNCMQIDSQENSKLNVTLNFGYKVMHVRMLNLKNGGFLLLQLVCSDKDCLGYTTFYVSRIHADGHHDNKPLEITGIKIDLSVLDRYKINLFEKSEDEFCMIVAGPATLSEFDIIVKKPHLTYVSKCFHRKYVSVS